MPQRTIEENMREMNRYLNEYFDALSSDADVGGIIGRVRRVGGKQLRPRLLLLCGMLGPEYGAASDRLCRLAAMLEAVHMASLVHDDVVDDSLTRRGVPTVQSEFGKKAAVYTGDLMISAIGAGALEGEFIASGKIIAETVSRMCQGELGQLCRRYDTQIKAEDYSEHIKGKTAAMFEAACQIGALESGLDKDTAEKLKNMGTQIGTAFQLRDDLLDLLGDPKKEGKPLGQDIREGSYTLPVIFALADKAQGEKLRRLLSKKRISRGGLRKAVSLIKAGGGIEKTRAYMEEALQKARDILFSLPECGAAAELAELIDFIAQPIEEAR